MQGYPLIGFFVSDPSFTPSPIYLRHRMPAIEQHHLQQIADQSRTLAEFYQQFLEHVCQELGGIGAVSWSCAQQPLRPIAQYHTSEDRPISMPISEQKHTELLLQAANSNSPALIRGQPIILMAKVRRGDATDLVELFLESDLSEEESRQRLKELALICQAAGGITSRKRAPGHQALNHSANLQTGLAAGIASSNSGVNISSAHLDEFAHVLHQSLDPRETASKIADETRRVLDCDRVTVFKVTGKRTRAVAVSGQPNVNRRSNAVARLERLAQRVLLTKQAFWYPAAQAQPPQIEKRLNDYLAESATRSMVIHPIFDTAKLIDKKPSDRHEVKQRLIGGIAIEQCDRQWDADAITAPIEMLNRHSGDAFRNAYQHRQLFAYPLWHWLGKSKIMFAARHISKTIAALVLLTVLGLVMAFVQTDFRMTCEGHLMPVTHRHVFANMDGVIADVFVEHGDDVSAGDSLVKIKNLDLDQQIQTASGRIDELTEVIAAARSTMSDRSARTDQEQQQENVSALKAQLKSAKRELELFQQKSERLTVVSPIAGQVVTYDVRDTLRDRPIQRVESLLEVADLDGDWILELNLSDRKIGHVLEAFEDNDREPLSVEFILAADPEKTYHGLLSEVGQTTEMMPDMGQVMRLKVSIEDPEFDLKQLRSGVSAYVQCGERSVGYAWFHSVWEFVQSKVLFPLF